MCLYTHVDLHIYNIESYHQFDLFLIAYYLYNEQNILKLYIYRIYVNAITHLNVLVLNVGEKLCKY